MAQASQSFKRQGKSLFRVVWRFALESAKLTHFQCKTWFELKSQKWNGIQYFCLERQLSFEKKARQSLFWVVWRQSLGGDRLYTHYTVESDFSHWFNESQLNFNSRFTIVIFDKSVKKSGFRLINTFFVFSTTLCIKLNNFFSFFCISNVCKVVFWIKILIMCLN